MKKVGVILPVYNSEKTIRNTIMSVIRQTCQDFQLIIVNDNSTDNTANICQDLCTKFNNLYFFNNTNKGVSSARNFALSKLDTEYVMFIDSDDIYEENMIEQMLKEIKEKDWAICSYRRILPEKAKKVKKVFKEEIQTFNDEQKNLLIENLQRNNLFNQVWNKIYKLEIIKSNHIWFDEEIDMGEDFKFNLQYIEQVKNIKYTQEILYNYYVSNTGLNNRYSNSKIKIKISNVKLQEQFYLKQNYDMEYIYNLYMLTIFSGLSEIVKYNNKKNIDRNLLNIMNDLDLKRTLTIIYRNTKQKKIRLLANILIKSSLREIKIYAKITIKIKSIYRRIKLNS